MRIILIHPNPLFSEGLRRILMGTPFQLACLVEAPDQIPAKLRNRGCNLFFVVGGNSSTERVGSVRAITQEYTSARIVAIGDHSEPSEVLTALEAGASGYLRETMSCEALVKALELVILGETVLPTQCIKQLPARADPIHESARLLPKPQPANGAQLSEVALSTREAAILRHLVHGASNKVIALRLAITEATVKVHIKAILRKMRVKNRTQAAIWAMNYLLSASEVLEERRAIVHGKSIAPSEPSYPVPNGHAY
jgi:two-component system nitrate/nitrite response regulator NarL